uniref:Zinc-ribbon domain protein n=1 Tax=virus sp. ct5rm7 TaxID=2827298 RepID=A0A8S5RGP3_9VIRU|nr:MAG TPA: zinc-ribbon domain protein [virus sp. ct5rm7]
MKPKTKVLCPQCGTEFAIADKERTMVATVIGKDSGLGVVYPVGAGQDSPPPQARLPKTAKERIEALRAAGIDVSHLFAMQGANGGECVASNKDGQLAILEDDDPIFRMIINQGDVPNRRLFRRWVMAQMFRMMTCTDYRSGEPMGVTGMIHRLGHEYQWKMLLNELLAQMKMEKLDPENFADRNRWFNAEMVEAMAKDYVKRLKEHIDFQKPKKCKGIPYKRIGSRNIFEADLETKIYRPLQAAIYDIRNAKDPARLYAAARKFNERRIKMSYKTPQSKAWMDAYKGAGAFFTMQNLIRFHGCTAINDKGKRLDKYQSLAFLTTKAEAYKDGEGWRLLAVLKKMLDDNNIDIQNKMAEWRKK